MWKGSLPLKDQSSKKSLPHPLRPACGEKGRQPDEGPAAEIYPPSAEKNARP
jgi:hypothetical protein